MFTANSPRDRETYRRETYVETYVRTTDGERDLIDYRAGTIYTTFTRTNTSFYRYSSVPVTMVLRWGCRVAAAAQHSLVGDCQATIKLNHSYSHKQEDVYFARRFFCDKCEERRNYVEIGALDGVRFSNTLMLERELNFGGLLIEGHPVSSSCLEHARGQSGRNVIFKEAICSPTGTLTFSGFPDGVAGDRTTMSPSAMKKWGQQHHLNSLNYTVRCRPISEMLRLAGLQVVHLFSLDVEGAELRVLETMDWTIPVHVWSVETDGSNPAKDAAVVALLGKHGYKRMPQRVFLNTIFVHSNLASTVHQRMAMCGACISTGPHLKHDVRSDKAADAAVAQAVSSGRSLCFSESAGTLLEQAKGG